MLQGHFDGSRRWWPKVDARRHHHYRTWTNSVISAVSTWNLYANHKYLELQQTCRTDSIVVMALYWCGFAQSAQMNDNYGSGLWTLVCFVGCCWWSNFWLSFCFTSIRSTQKAYSSGFSASMFDVRDEWWNKWYMKWFTSLSWTIDHRPSSTIYSCT